MSSSLGRIARLSTVSLQRAVGLVDKAFRLHDVAIRNAAHAVAADRVAARLRAVAADSLVDAALRPELTVVGA